MNNQTTSNNKSDKLKALILKYKLEKENARSNATDNPATSNPNLSNSSSGQQITEDGVQSRDNAEQQVVEGIGRTGEKILYNKEQQEFIHLSSKGKSCILIGAAGTGKTTCMRGCITTLIQSGYAGILSAESHKYLPPSGSPGIVAISYTRRAVSNLRRAMPRGMEQNCITIHKLLEYEPVFYQVIDPETGDSRSTMRFEPTRNRFNPLPSSIQTVIIDESSMVSVELFDLLREALPHNPQFIFLGDIQQLPPVFGSAILGYKMLELPTIELTQVYRQALESPIIRLAHRILSGTPIPASEFPDWKFPDKLTLHPWKKKIHQDAALITAAQFFKKGYDEGIYDPIEDMILIPFNKSFGTDELNKHIANHLAKKEKRIVYEVIAGFEKFYFSIGDKILYDKEDATIISIARNPTYTGKTPQTEARTLDYWGFNSESSAGVKSKETASEEEIDFLLAQSASAGDDEEKVNKASHIITVRMNDTLQEISIDATGEVKGLLMGYALTIHKSQGSEWRKVFLIFHQSHATMLQRELLYTAVTRAKEELYVICEPESFVNGIRSQRIKGNTLAEKAEWFKGKKDEKDQLIGGK